MTPVADRLWHDAVHEAGRAVVSRALGLTSGYANLVPDYEEPSPGTAFIFDALQASEWNRLHPERHGNDGAFWRGRIIATMAGAEAELEIIGICAGSGGHEREQCDSTGEDLGYSGDWPQRAVRMRRFARQLVKRHRGTILRFAEQLIAADELDEFLASRETIC
jgi:hypothetical protein